VEFTTILKKYLLRKYKINIPLTYIFVRNKPEAKVLYFKPYPMRGLRHIRQFNDKDMAITYSCSIVGCRMDYCNALLHEVTQKNFDNMQRVQNSLARLICNAMYRCSSQPLFKSLHWLPVIERI